MLNTDLFIKNYFKLAINALTIRLLCSNDNRLSTVSFFWKSCELSCASAAGDCHGLTCVRAELELQELSAESADGQSIPSIGCPRYGFIYSQLSRCSQPAASGEARANCITVHNATCLVPGIDLNRLIGWFWERDSWLPECHRVI